MLQIAESLAVLSRLVQAPEARLTLKISPMPWCQFGAKSPLDRWKK